MAEEGRGASGLPDIRRLAHPEEIDGLTFGDLSDWFNPFLGYFLAEALRCGGEALVAEDARVVAGLCVDSPTERIASILTRSEPVAREFYRRRAGGSVYAPFPLSPGAEEYHIYEVRANEWADESRLPYPIRFATPADLPAVASVLRGEYGEVDDRWLATMPRDSERCFLVEFQQEVAGVAWASLVGAHGRLHSLTVRSRFRRLGIGAELVRARILWLRAAGADRIISEVADRNTGSRRVAERCGMARVGQIFRHEVSERVGDRVRDAT